MLKIVNKKRFIATAMIVIGLIALLAYGIIWGVNKYRNRDNPENQPQVYEALVNIVDQKTSDPVEDARSSLKKGDVIAYFPEGHSWSDTEKNSYLLVKLKLKPEEAIKLLEAETRETKRQDTRNLPTGQAGKEQNPDEKSASPADKDMGPQMETIRARKYRLDLPEFDVQKFWENQTQPFADKIFDAGIIDKK